MFIFLQCGFMSKGFLVQSYVRYFCTNKVFERDPIDHLYVCRFYFLSLNIVRTQVLLEIEVRNLDILGWLEEILELLVEDEHATVVGVLETVVLHVLVHGARHLTTGDELPLGKTKENTKLFGNLLLAVETVVLRTIGRLLTGGILLGGPDLANNLGERLDVVADGGDFSENGFSRHIIPLI